MSIHIKDLQEMINILRDVQTYMYMIHKNDTLGNHIMKRIDRVLIDDKPVIPEERVPE
jgi:hypothetical protein